MIDWQVDYFFDLWFDGTYMLSILISFLFSNCVQQLNCNDVKYIISSSLIGIRTTERGFILRVRNYSVLTRENIYATEKLEMATKGNFLLAIIPWFNGLCAQ